MTERASAGFSDGIVTRTIVQFCRFLRANSFQVGLQETIDALAVVRLVTITDREAFQSSLRALLCSSREQYEQFDRLFEQFWGDSTETIHLQREDHPSRREMRLIGDEHHRAVEQAGKSHEEGDLTATTGASAEERLRKMDFSEVAASDLPLLEQLCLRLWRQMSERLTRRYRRYGERGRLDFRRTIRSNISRGGEPMTLHYKERKRQKINLVVLLDVSGSMDLYSLFLLRFVYALQQYFERVDSFVFSTRLTDISGALRTHQLSSALQMVAQNVESWSGGTRIGECLAEFNKLHARKLRSRNSLVIIMSDGWDTGEPEALKEQLQAIKRRARKLIWLNPLLGLAEYQPITRGMSAALPFADVFAPAHSLESLLQLEHHLS